MRLVRWGDGGERLFYIISAGKICDIWFRHIYCSTSGMEIKQDYFHSSQFLRIFAVVASHILFTPQQCNSNKFACIAFGFCVYMDFDHIYCSTSAK